MTLRARLVLLVASTVLLGLGLFGALAYLDFVRQQNAQLEGLLRRDLARVEALMENPSAGASLVGEDAGFTLQLVDNQGRVVLPLDIAEPLPLFREPTLDAGPSGKRLVASLPWSVMGTESGTVRLALDVDAPLRTRTELLRILVLSGALIAIAALAVGLALLGRALRPLVTLAGDAGNIDPARPRLASYRGPDDEVAALARALNAALDDIRKRQEAERASLAEISHELAGPLTLVAGHLDALTKGDGHDQQLLAARDAARELLFTSQDLLTLARGELERPLNLEIFDLCTVLTRIASEYPGVKLELPPQRPCDVAGSPLRMAQLFRNLVRNAVQATGGPERVAVRLAAEAGRLKVSVRDQGPGIAPEDLPHVFDRYYSRRGGAGVGLSVARSIAMQHGGTVSVDSVPGRGSCFTVVLPSLEAQLD